MMSQLLLVCAVVLAITAATRFLSSFTNSTNAFTKSPQTNPCWNPAADIPLTGVACGTMPKLQLSCYLPMDIRISSNFNNTRRQEDIFSW